MPKVSLYHEVLARCTYANDDEAVAEGMPTFLRAPVQWYKLKWNRNKKRRKHTKKKKNHWLARKHTTASKHNINSIRHALKQFSTDTFVYSKQVGNMAFHMLVRRMQASWYAGRLHTSRFNRIAVYSILCHVRCCHWCLPSHRLNIGKCYVHLHIAVYVYFIYSTRLCSAYIWGRTIYSHTHSDSVDVNSANLLNGWIIHIIFHLFTHMIAVAGAKSTPANECNEYYNSSILIKRNTPTLWQRMEQ